MQETGESAGKLHPAAFHSQRELPDSLPDGAHRVISTMTAAQMRKMMEGVVLYRHRADRRRSTATPRAARPAPRKRSIQATHLYSKTKHIASFVGIAPVNNPVISIAVIIDNPQKGPSYYGTAVSAPVFAEVAQKVLEYLGVPHDTTSARATGLGQATCGPGTG